MTQLTEIWQKNTSRIYNLPRITSADLSAAPNRAWLQCRIPVSLTSSQEQGLQIKCVCTRVRDALSTIPSGHTDFTIWSPDCATSVAVLAGPPAQHTEAEPGSPKQRRDGRDPRPARPELRLLTAGCHSCSTETPRPARRLGRCSCNSGSTCDLLQSEPEEAGSEMIRGFHCTQSLDFPRSRCSPWSPWDERLPPSAAPCSAENRVLGCSQGAPAKGGGFPSTFVLSDSTKATTLLALGCAGTMQDSFKPVVNSPCFSLPADLSPGAGTKVGGGGKGASCCQLLSLLSSRPHLQQGVKAATADSNTFGWLL